jgi:hypothetical protein
VAKVRIDNVVVVGVKNVLLAPHRLEGEKQQRGKPRATMARKDMVGSITAISGS